MTTVPLGRWVAMAAAAALAVALASQVTPAQEPDISYTPVTDERLREGDPSDWLMYRRTYDSQGYSPLDQINRENVGDLVPVWTMSTGVTSGHEAPPIVNDGVMFVTTPEDRVIAIDARSGEQLWIYNRQFPEGMAHPHRTNRGVALYGDKVFVATPDSDVVALDSKTGEVVWHTNIGNWEEAYTMTVAPLVV